MKEQNTKENERKNYGKKKEKRKNIEGGGGGGGIVFQESTCVVLHQAHTHTHKDTAAVLKCIIEIHERARETPSLSSSFSYTNTKRVMTG